MKMKPSSRGGAKAQRNPKAIGSRTLVKRPRTRHELIPLLRQELGAADAARLEPWVLPAVGFKNGRVGRESEMIGATRFGGRPDLPHSVTWPEGPTGPMAFLGQIALKEVAEFDVDQVLPNAGTLLFFYNIVDYAWGIQESDRGKFEVVFTSPETELHRREFPRSIATQNRLPRARRLKPYMWWQLPTADPLARCTLDFQELNTDHENWSSFTKKYWKLEWALTRPHVPVGTHQLLGWANGIFQQGEDARFICELAHQGFPSTRKASNVAAAERHRWRCLLQIGEDRDLYQDTWADGGSIAFMIRDSDLQRGDFSRCWCLLSST